MTLQELFPPHSLKNEGFLKVSNLHTIYYQEYGNANGVPVIICHGGPGGGITSDMPRFFDPDKYRIILFDQRGCGKSTPHAELKENTTWDLVEDMEKIRDLFSIKKWLVFGGSWGSTLALVYAIKHPQRTLGLILRGIFTLRKEELLWTYQDGVDWFFPEEFEQYKKIIPKNEQHDMIKAYYKRLCSDDKNLRLKAAKAWSLLEGTIVSLLPNKKREKEFTNALFAESFARIECHYFINGGFFPNDSFILDNCDKIKHLPIFICHGRYDIITPLKTAWELHQRLPLSTLNIIANAGHSSSELGIIDGLVRATDKIYKQLQ